MADVTANSQRNTPWWKNKTKGTCHATLKAAGINKKGEDMEKLICPNCGFSGSPKTITKGSFSVELILWLFFIPPGLIYSVWRLASRYEGCPSCGANSMIPLDSPRGKQLLSEGK